LSLASAGPISRGLVHYQAQSQLGLASSRPRVIRKFSIVILESLYTQFLLGPSNNSTSKAPTTNLDRYLDGLKDCPCISPLTGYYMHPGKKNKFIKFKEIITSEKKMIENQHTTKCWALLSTNCCIFFWRLSLCICVSTKRFIGLDSCLRTVAYNKKILSVKYIYKK
jgi:hypothetical protein